MEGNSSSCKLRSVFFRPERYLRLETSIGTNSIKILTKVYPLCACQSRIQLQLFVLHHSPGYDLWIFPAVLATQHYVHYSSIRTFACLFVTSINLFRFFPSIFFTSGWYEEKLQYIELKKLL